jgi:hypothetical protein
MMMRSASKPRLVCAGLERTAAKEIRLNLYSKLVCTVSV